MNSTTCKVLAILLFLAADLAGPPTRDGQGSAPALSKEQVLARWADALGGREALQTVANVHLRGSIETSGLKGTYERWITSRGEFRTSVDLSDAFRQTNIFDGQEGWVLDTSGTVHELSGDTLKGVVSASYEASYSFLFSDRLPGQVELVGGDQGQGEYVVRLMPENGSVVTVYLDRKTFLPSREEARGPMGNRVIHFSDWRDFAGIRFPGWIGQSSGNPGFDAVITTEKVDINVPIATHVFQKPRGVADQIHFDSGMPEAVVPAEVYGDHIFVPVRVNGSKPAWF